MELTPDDEYIEYIDEIKESCLKNLGALCHITVPRDERKEGFPLMTSLSREDFVKTWSVFDSTLFSFKESIFEKKRNEYCYAGKWSYTIDLISGRYARCYRGGALGNLYNDEEIIESAIGCNCPEGHCFNGHAFLGFGLIPQMKTPLYLEMRDRVNDKGEHWIKATMAQAMESKLCEMNKKDGVGKKLKQSKILRKIYSKVISVIKR